jgi:hypothetical protein
MSEERHEIAQAHHALRDEHERLLELVARLRMGPVRPELEALLRDLPGLLAAHFRREEEPGGLYDVVGVSLGDARGELGQLVDDHFRLVASARNLAEQALEPGVPTQTLLDAALRVADYLVDHERREYELVRALLERG